MKIPQAQDIALQLFHELANDFELLERFFTLTGLGPQNLRQIAATPGFYSAILDFASEQESDLIKLAQRAQINPEDIVAARQALSPHSEFD